MPSSSQRRWSAPLIAGVICAVLAAGYVVFMFRTGRSDEKSSQTAAHHTIQVGTFSTAIDYAPLLVAQEKGWLQSELPGEQIEVTTFQTLPSINEAFAAGKLDVVFEAEVPAIIGRAGGADIRITGLEATLHEGILVSSSVRANNIGALKGKKVAVLSGTAMHYGVVQLLQSSGLDSHSVSFLNMVPPDAAAAFASHQVDGWAVWPPWAEQQIVAKTGYFIPGAVAQVQSVIVMRKGFLDANAKEAQGITRAIARAKVWLQQNESEGIQLIAQKLNISPDVVRLAWPKHDWKADLTPDVSQDLENKIQFLVNEQLIQHAISMKDLASRVEAVP